MSIPTELEQVFAIDDGSLPEIRVDGTDLPELGVAPFEDAIIIDYRMGPAWDAKRIDALFELLRRICAVKAGAHIEIEPEADPKLRRAFQKAWMQYLTRR